eukprot:10580190-Prorocentrum_lima.AAC.1
MHPTNTQVGVPYELSTWRKTTALWDDQVESWILFEDRVPIYEWQPLHAVSHRCVSRSVHFVQPS